jgi:hypothetical protein
VERIAASTGLTQLEFMAVSNRSYSILVTTNLTEAPWSKLLDVLPRVTNRVETIVDAAPAARRRFYRLSTPPLP